MFFSNLCKSKNGNNLLVFVLTCFFLKLLVLACFAQTRASQKMGKLTSFGVDGLKLRTMGKIDSFWCWHVFLKLLESKICGKLTIFGVDMFFLNSWNPKKWWKLTSFGVDMFFSNSWESKKWGKLISFGVVDTFFLKLLVLTCFSQTRASQKMGKID